MARMRHMSKAEGQHFLQLASQVAGAEFKLFWINPKKSQKLLMNMLIMRVSFILDAATCIPHV